METENPNMPDFKSIEERDAWIIEHAKYFTVLACYGLGRSFERNEVSSSLDDAIALAQSLVKTHFMRCMIYAVAPPYDAFVKAVYQERKNGCESKRANASS
jgi:hypothetical protein